MHIKLTHFVKKSVKKRCALHNEQRQCNFYYELKIYGKEKSIVILIYEMRIRF